MHFEMYKFHIKIVSHYPCNCLIFLDTMRRSQVYEELCIIIDPVDLANE